MIRVLIVEDSLATYEMLKHIISSDRDMEVAGRASTGLEAIGMIGSVKPDVVTMDICLPGIDGFEATKTIMRTNPLPIIILSSIYKKEDMALSFRSIEAGALAILEKPAAMNSPGFEEQRKALINTVKMMSEIKVVGRRHDIRQDKKKPIPAVNSLPLSKIKLIAVGASTGGPQALQSFLKELKGVIFPPVLIVQHITNGFTKGFADWLTESCGIDVKIPVYKEQVRFGIVYVAPDDFHMGISRGGQIELDGGPPLNSLRPSVSYLFRSAAGSFGDGAIGVILSGMGRDGSAELGLMREAGALTFAQDGGSSVVNGMPGEAVKLGNAVYIMPPDEIGRKIADILKRQM